MDGPCGFSKDLLLRTNRCGEGQVDDQRRRRGEFRTSSELTCQDLDCVPCVVDNDVRLGNFQLERCEGNRGTSVTSLFVVAVPQIEGVVCRCVLPSET